MGKTVGSPTADNIVVSIPSENLIAGDGLQFRDFVHVKDIGRGIILAYQNDQVRSGQPINLGSGEAHTVQVGVV